MYSSHHVCRWNHHLCCYVAICCHMLPSPIEHRPAYLPISNQKGYSFNPHIWQGPCSLEVKFQVSFMINNSNLSCWKPIFVDLCPNFCWLKSHFGWWKPHVWWHFFSIERRVKHWWNVAGREGFIAHINEINNDRGLKEVERKLLRTHKFHPCHPGVDENTNQKEGIQVGIGLEHPNILSTSGGLYIYNHIHT